MESLTVTLTGVTPILMHKPTLVDPRHPLAKQTKNITSKHHSKKTEEDQIELQRIELLAGLYWSEDAQAPMVPAHAVEGAIFTAAKNWKLGAQFKKSVFVLDQECPLVGYKGPKTAEKFLASSDNYDVRAVKVGSGRVIRSRPLVRTPWKISCSIAYDEAITNREDLVKVLDYAGRYCGLLDMRPRFGAFKSEVK